MTASSAAVDAEIRTLEQAMYKGRELPCLISTSARAASKAAGAANHPLFPMTTKKKPRTSKYTTLGLPDHPPWTGKYATLQEALMNECTPGRPMPEWLYLSLVIVFDQYMRGTITNLGHAFGCPVMSSGQARKSNLAPGIYQWITMLCEQDPTTPLSKKKPRGAYCQAAQAFGISASTAEKYYEAYRHQILNFPARK